MSRVRCVMDDKVVAVTTDDAFRKITAMVSSHPGVKVERPDASSLVVVTRYTPGWAIIVGLLLLPIVIGLLIFLVKREDRVTIIGRDVEGGARFTVAGWTNTRVAGDLKGYLVPVDTPAT